MVNYYNISIYWIFLRNYLNGNEIVLMSIKFTIYDKNVTIKLIITKQIVKVSIFALL